MAVKFRIPKDQVPDLVTIRNLGAVQLQKIIDHLATCEVLPLRPANLIARVVESLDGDTETAESVVRSLLPLNQLIRQSVRTVDGVLEGLRNGIATLPDWSPEDKAAWQSIEPQLRQLFQADAIRTVSKATDLAYDHANLFQGARIVTDIRPVFNDLEQFTGFVDYIEGPTAFVTLTTEAGEELAGEYPADELAELGICENRRFKCQTVITDSGVEVCFQPIPDIEVTPEEEMSIDQRLDELISGCELDGDY